MLRIKTRSIGTLLILALLTLGMGFVGWLVTRQTAGTVYLFESITLPEISTALSLSEDVAQLAAISPYIANTASPFQLEGERTRLEQKFHNLKFVAKNIKDNNFRSDLELRLNRLFTAVDELTNIVGSELFIREDLLALRFDIDDILPVNNKRNNADKNLHRIVNILQRLTQSNQISIANSNITDFKEANDLISLISDKIKSAKAAALLEKIFTSYNDLTEYNNKKRYLISSIRAQSEELTTQANIFVGNLKKNVFLQREAVSHAVSQGQFWVLLMSLLILISFAYSTWFNYGVTRDLEAVTRDMTRLAEGDTNMPAPAVERSDELGDLARTFNVFRRDAMQMKQVSEALKAQSKLLETVFNQIHDGLSVFSQKQQLVAWNQRYLELFTLDENEIYNGMAIAEVQQLMSRKPHTNLSIDGSPIDIEGLNSIRSQSAQTFERHYHSGDVIEFRSQPMPEGGFVTLYTDLTERKMMQQQLIQSQKMEVLGQLTGGVAHDFNNLLAAILGNLQLLDESENLNERQKKQITRTLQATEKGVNLVQRLLAFSRKQQLFPEKINIDNLLLFMLDLIEYSVGDDVEVITDLNTENTNIFVDPSQLENAILNLAINSSQAMPKGGKLIFRTLITQEDDRTSPIVKLVVEDSGVGIPKDLQERIFEPFYTTKPVGKGSGLGLSMVYGFVTQSGGELDIESEPKQGTKVSLKFPSDTSQIETKALNQNTSIKIELPANANVFIVEDNTDVQKTITQQFESLGFTVECLTHAEPLIKAMRDKNSSNPLADLILTDINLQGSMSGVEFLSLCRDELPEQKILLTSGMPREVLEDRFGLKPNDPLLPKPISLEQLKGIIDIKH